MSAAGAAGPVCLKPHVQRPGFGTAGQDAGEVRQSDWRLDNVV